MGCRLVAAQDLNDRRHAAVLHALLNIFDAIIEEDDIIIETMLLMHVVKHWDSGGRVVGSLFMHRTARARRSE